MHPRVYVYDGAGAVPVTGDFELFGHVCANAGEAGSASAPATSAAAAKTFMFAAPPVVYSCAHGTVDRAAGARAGYPASRRRPTTRRPWWHARVAGLIGPCRDPEPGDGRVTLILCATGWHGSPSPSPGMSGERRASERRT